MVPTEINMYPYSINSLIHYNALFVHSGYAVACIAIIIILHIYLLKLWGEVLGGVVKEDNEI